MHTIFEHHIAPALPAGPQRPRAAIGSAILAAAMLLPGMRSARANNPPEHASLNLSYLHYRDSQPGLDRISVKSPSLSLLTPIAGAWSLAASVTADDVSGASPRYHTAVSGASRMSDRRSAADVTVTRYFSRASVGIGAAYSTEHDYESRALSLQGTVSSEDNNTTWAFGIGGADDAINPVNLLVVGASRQSVNLMAGVTRVMGPRDIVQLTFTRTQGHGYFSDPYKLDQRPAKRDQNTALLRWNHHLADSGATARLAYRYYVDSYGIRAHTLTAEYVQNLPGGWIVTPSLRLYTQRAAAFYYDPVYDSVLGAPFPPGYVFGAGRTFSADPRLAGFGALTGGLQVSKQVARDWTVELKMAAYQQRASWRLFGDGSPGLAPLRARSLQLGLTRQW